jgi:hypothetical protein
MEQPKKQVGLRSRRLEIEFNEQAIHTLCNHRRYRTVDEDSVEKRRRDCQQNSALNADVSDGANDEIRHKSDHGAKWRGLLLNPLVNFVNVAIFLNTEVGQAS